MEKSEAFALNMRLFRALVFQWGRDETNSELRKKVQDLENQIIQSVYPNQKSIAWSSDHEKMDI